MNRPELWLKHLPTESDTTLYLKAQRHGVVEELIQKLPALQQRYSKYAVDCQVQLIGDGPGIPGPARIVACKCFRGTKWSITIRREGSSRRGARSAIRRPAGRASNFELSRTIKPGFFTSLAATCDLLYAEIFLEPHRTGLIVITGATGSGKSEITRGLIHKYMLQATEANRKRRPHLITFEDPIEKFYVKGEGYEYDQPHAFDYTPREKGVDATSVQQVLKDALRQTPALVFVGEIRDLREWRSILDFVSTGHSLIATAHAGSLAEAWGKILEAVEARHAAQRSDIADRILGMVHLRSLGSSGVQGAFPALWRYTASGAKSMTADGRAALMPLRGYAPLASSFGRLPFIEQIKSQQDPRLKISSESFKNLTKHALLSDLEGL
jgi:type IV secretory pathway ATPase VirB11/archaellum biosynthesis ATPase